jgi:hypothetical protein
MTKKVIFRLLTRSSQFIIEITANSGPPRKAEKDLSKIVDNLLQSGSNIQKRKTWVKGVWKKILV